MASSTGFQKDAEGYYICKDPNAQKDYTIDFSKWLKNGDILTGAAWIIPEGITKIDDGFTSTTAWIELAGGTLGKNYMITVHITTAQAHEDDQSFRLVIRGN